MHQTILPGTHTPLTGVSTPCLYCGTPIVLSLLLSSRLLGGLLLFLVSGSNVLALGSQVMGFFSPLQQGSLFFQHFIPESLDVFQLLLLLRNPPFFGLFLGFGLCFSPGFLSHTLCITGLHCLLQSKDGLLLLLMPSLHLMVLLLKYFSIVLRNIGGGGERHNDTETRAKNFLSVCVLLIQVPSWGFQVNSIGLQRLSPKGGILSYTSPPIWKLHLCRVKHTSLSSMVATFLTTHLMAVLQPSGYSVFHDGDTPIQLGLP